MKNQENFIPNENFPDGTAIPQREDVTGILDKYGIGSVGDVSLIDSTRSAEDIRLNYIIDKKWVLRFCNAPDMTEKRLGSLFRLIERYRAAKIQCPQFIAGKDGNFINTWNGLTCYLQEYIDLPLASEKHDIDAAGVYDELLENVALFAKENKNVDLSDTMGMYSLFDLSPFDIPEGIDEKEQNFNLLIEILKKTGADELAGKLIARHTDVRAKLKSVYRGLPRCVFQGDENFTNILVDENNHFAGLIDFNLAGTEVIVNQFANLAGFDYLEEEEKPAGASKRLAYAIENYRRNMKLMLRYYPISEQERTALQRYAWIVMISRWPEVCLFRYWIEKTELKNEALELISQIADLPEESLNIR